MTRMTEFLEEQVSDCQSACRGWQSVTMEFEPDSDTCKFTALTAFTLAIGYSMVSICGSSFEEWFWPCLGLTMVSQWLLILFMGAATGEVLCGDFDPDCIGFDHYPWLKGTIAVLGGAGGFFWYSFSTLGCWSGWEEAGYQECSNFFMAGIVTAPWSSAALATLLFLIFQGIEEVYDAFDIWCMFSDCWENLTNPSPLFRRLFRMPPQEEDGGGGGDDDVFGGEGAEADPPPQVPAAPAAPVIGLQITDGGIGNGVNAIVA